MTGCQPGGRPRALGPPRRVRIAFAAGRLAVVVGLVTASLGVVAGAPISVDAARTWHVSTAGSDTASGTSSQPLRTIATAVNRASSGDTIEIRGGVYRESVQVFRKALHLRSRSGERAVLDGSVPVDGWRRSGALWSVPWDFAPRIDGHPRVPPARPEAGFPDQVFIDGAPSEQVLFRAQVRPSTFFHDRAANRLWIGADPADHRITVSNRSWGIYLNEADGSRLTNLTVRGFATERRHMAAVRAYSDDVVLDGVVAEHNAAIGISVIGADVTVRNGRASGNGYLGVHADRATRVTVSDMSIVDNNRVGFDPFHSAGGIKVTTSTDVVVRDSDVSANGGPGIWFDVSSRRATIVGNLATNNLRSGIQVELTNGSIVAGNVSIANGENGVWVLESTDALVWNNTLIDNTVQLEVEEGPRRDVNDVGIANNVLGSRAASGRALLDVNDWTESRSAREMGVTADHNVHRVTAGASVAVSRWGRWPAPLAVSTTIDEHRTATGQGGASTRTVGGSDVLEERGCQQVSITAATAVLPGAVAAVLGSESVPVAGAPTAPIRRGLNWPVDVSAPTPELGGDVTDAGLRLGVRTGRRLPIPCS